MVFNETLSSELIIILKQMENIAEWSTSYFILAALFLLFFVVFLFVTVKDYRSHQANSTQIPYLIAVFSRGLGFVVSGLIVKSKNDSYWKNWSIITNGLPGYIVATAYCFIFFSWCSVCVECLAKKNIKFFDKTKQIMLILIIIIWIEEIITLLCFYLIDSSSSGTHTAHYVEASFAVLRDFAIAAAFLVYLIKIWKLFNSACGCSSNESVLFFMCGLLFVAMLLRGISIIAYVILIAHDHDNTLEWSIEYFAAFVVEQIIFEVLPLGAICVLKLQSEYVAASHKQGSFVNFEEV